MWIYILKTSLWMDVCWSRCKNWPQPRPGPLTSKSTPPSKRSVIVRVSTNSPQSSPSESSGKRRSKQYRGEPNKTIRYFEESQLTRLVVLCRSSYCYVVNVSIDVTQPSFTHRNPIHCQKLGKSPHESPIVYRRSFQSFSVVSLAGDFTASIFRFRGTPALAGDFSKQRNRAASLQLHITHSSPRPLRCWVAFELET